jgi:hypothetical protein
VDDSVEAAAPAPRKKPVARMRREGELDMDYKRMKKVLEERVKGQCFRMKKVLKERVKGCFRQLRRQVLTLYMSGLQPFFPMSKP